MTATVGAVVVDIATREPIGFDARDVAVRCYTVAELAELWRCGKTYIYVEIRDGRLKTISLGRGGRDKVRIRATDAIAWLAEHADT